jgi:hypothetical protein
MSRERDLLRRALPFLHMQVSPFEQSKRILCIEIGDLLDSPESPIDHKRDGLLSSYQLGSANRGGEGHL